MMEPSDELAAATPKAARTKPKAHAAPLSSSTPKQETPEQIFFPAERPRPAPRLKRKGDSKEEVESKQQEQEQDKWVWYRGSALCCRAATSILRWVTGKYDEFRGMSRLHACSTSKPSQETQYLASILSDTFVRCICRKISYAQGKGSLRTRVEISSRLHWVTRLWRRTLTNGSDVKDVFPRCQWVALFPQNERTFAPRMVKLTETPSNFYSFVRQS